MTRLSIIDTSKIQIPITSEDSKIAISFNGEIYNYKALRESLSAKGHKFSSNCDAEVLVHLYEDKGIDCLKEINGMFAFALWDSERKCLFLVRDRLGIKPMFYFEMSNGFIFASEINSIIASGLVGLEVDETSLTRFLTFRYNFGEATLFKGIKRLEPGTYLKVSDGVVHKKKYWELIPRKSKEPEKELRYLINDSVRLMLQSDVPVGLFLSGGIDSSIVGYFAKRHKKRLMSFSMDYGRNQRAEISANAIGTKHFSFRYSKEAINLLPEILKRLGEPLADPAAIPTYLLAKNASVHCTVVLSGEGADEIFGGYEQYKIMLWTSKLPQKITKLVKPLLNLAPPNLVESLSKKRNSEEAYISLISLLPNDRRVALLKHNLQQDTAIFSRERSLVYNMLLYDLSTFLPEDNLFRLDMMLMAHSIEGRVPFLDHRIVELAFGLPDHLRISGLRDKVILRKILYGELPKKILESPKSRWIFPTDKFFPVSDFKRIFSDRRFQKYLNRIEVFSLLRDRRSFRDCLSKLHPLARLYKSRQLWNFLCFGVWYKQHILGEEVRFQND